MNRWIKQIRNKYLKSSIIGWVVGIMMIALLALLFGDTDSRSEMIMALVILVSLSAITAACTLILSNIIRLKRMVKKQAATYDIDLDYEFNDIEKIKGFAFTSDWFLCESAPNYAIYRMNIENYSISNVSNGKYMTNSIEFRLKDGSTYNIPIANNEKRMAVLEKLDTWSGIVIEQSDNYNPSGLNPMDIETKEPKDFKTVLAVIAGMAIMAGLIMFVYDGAISAKTSKTKDDQSSKVITKVLDNCLYDNCAAYTKYLKPTEGNLDDVEVYLDESSVENEYYLSVYNYDENLMIGSVALNDEDGKLVKTIEMDIVRPQNYISGSFTLAKEPTRYIIEDVDFLEFTYPHFTDYTWSEDYSEDYYWYNLVLSADDLLEKNVTTIAKRFYAECVIVNSNYETLYFYDEDSATKYQDGEYSNYDPTSSKFSAIVDLDQKVVEIYKVVGEEFELINSIEME